MRKIRAFNKLAIRRFRVQKLLDDKICDNLEFARQVIRQRQRDKRRAKRNPHSGRSNKYLTLEQFASVMNCFGEEMSERDKVNRMLIILLAESGLRAGEACELKITDLPVSHGKHAIEVRHGKGNYPRTVVISHFLAEEIEKFLPPGIGKKDYFLMDERSKKMSYSALYQRVKRVMKKAGIEWAHPHTLRHTFATHLVTIVPDWWFAKRQLGHKFKDITGDYVGDVEEISKTQMKEFHNRLWSHQKQGFLAFNKNKS